MIIPKEEQEKRGDYDHAPNTSVISNQSNSKSPKGSVINNQGSNNERSSNWTILVYPESAPDNWRDILKKEHIKFIVSPLHDKDVFEDTGELKKPHWHVILLFSSLKSKKQVQEISDKVNGPRPETVHDLGMMVTYLYHGDDEDKYQYDPSDIETYGDVDLNKFLQTKKDRYELIEDVFKYIRVSKITEFQDLIDYSLDYKKKWFHFFCDHGTYIFEAYIRSLRNRFE